MASIDPNKYLKNKDIKAESKLSVLIAIVRMGLVLAGIIGIALEMFRENGWLSKLLGKLFESTTTMMFIPVIIFVLWLLNRWISSPNKSETKKSGDFPMYIMMAVGVYYLFRLYSTGSFQQVQFPKYNDAAGVLECDEQNPITNVKVIFFHQPLLKQFQQQALSLQIEAQAKVGQSLDKTLRLA